MKKRMTAVLAAASLLFVLGAYAEGEPALSDAKTVMVQSPAEIAEQIMATGSPVVVRTNKPTREPLVSEGDLYITEEYRWFISQYDHIRSRKVRYYDDVYAYNHGDYMLTPFDYRVPAEYFTVDTSGTYAIAPIVLDITDAMRIALYGGDRGEVSMYYGQYCERRGNGRGSEGFTGVHEGVDFTYEAGAPLFALLGGEVTRAGKDKDGTVAVYNKEYDVTVLYLHCKDIDVRVGSTIPEGEFIGREGSKGTKNNSGIYTHVEVRRGRHTSANAYRNTVLESECPYPVMQAALGVTESGRQPVTAAAVKEAQRMREEAEAAARAKAEAEKKAQEETNEPEIELIDVLPGANDGYGFVDPTPAPEATLPPVAP